MEHKSSTGKFLSLKVFVMIFLGENHLFSKSAAYVVGFNSAQLYLSPLQRIFRIVLRLRCFGSVVLGLHLTAPGYYSLVGF